MCVYVDIHVYWARVCVCVCVCVYIHIYLCMCVCVCALRAVIVRTYVLDSMLMQQFTAVRLT